MSKVYEALEIAQRQKKGFVNKTEPPQVEKTSLKTQKYEMEDEMTKLYQAINPLLPHIHEKAIQFISSQEGEGTSTIIREFAHVLAVKFHKNVLILDADRHKPSQHFYFNINPLDGWENVINNSIPIDNVIYRVGESNLFVSSLSSKPESVSHIFDCSRFDIFLEKLKQRFDFILIDSTPVSICADSLCKCPKVDGIILVVEAEKTRWPTASSVKERIIKNGGELLGIVFTKRRYHIPEFIYKRL